MSEPEIVMKPDERAFRADLSAGAFQLGVHEGRWRLGTIAWPMVDIAVAAAERKGAPLEYWLRFNCFGYPQAASTARPWDPSTDQPLAAGKWPDGASRVPAVFRPDWKDGVCLYLPCDRMAAEGHDNWPTEYPSLQWSPERGIVLYLNEVHALLNSGDYKGTREA